MKDWVSTGIRILERQIFDSGVWQHELPQKVEELERKITVKLDERTLIGLRQGFQHLSAAQGAETESGKQSELLLAREKFCALASLDPKGITEGETYSIDNGWLIGLGHWGNSHYFHLVGENRNALLEVYECTYNHPAVGLTMFSSEHFSESFKRNISELEDSLTQLSVELGQAKGHNIKEGASAAAKTLAVVGAGGYVGAATMGIITFVTGGIGAPLGAIVGVATASAVANLVNWEEPDWFCERLLTG